MPEPALLLSRAVGTGAGCRCCPHPLHGGALHSKAVFRTAKSALELGLPTLRLNFRGVGQSQGKFDDGIGERDDQRAGLNYLGTRFPQVPVCVIGFSIGAFVGLAVGAADPRVCALVALGPPLASEGMDFLRDVQKPKLIIQGTQDPFGPRPQLEALCASLAGPKRLRWVDGPNRFFTSRFDRVESLLGAFLLKVLATISPAGQDSRRLNRLHQDVAGSAEVEK